MKQFINQINKWYDKFNKLNEWVIIFLMSAMCVDLLAQVGARYLFQHPLTWSDELARYMFVDCASGLCLVRAKPYSCSDDCGDGNAS